MKACNKNYHNKNRGLWVSILLVAIGIFIIACEDTSVNIDQEEEVYETQEEVEKDTSSFESIHTVLGGGSRFSRVYMARVYDGVPLKANIMLEYFKRSDTDIILVTTRNNSWTPAVHLPTSTEIPNGKVVLIKRYANSPTKIYGNGMFFGGLRNGEAAQFTYRDGTWLGKWLVPRKVDKDPVYEVMLTPNQREITANEIRNYFREASFVQISLDAGHSVNDIYLPSTGISFGSGLFIYARNDGGTRLRTADGKVRSGNITGWYTYVGNSGSGWNGPTNYVQSARASNVAFDNGEQMTSDDFKQYFQSSEVVTITVKEGHWTKNIFLPTHGMKDGNTLFVTRYSRWRVYVQGNGLVYDDIGQGNTVRYVYHDGWWYGKGIGLVTQYDRVLIPIVANGKSISANLIGYYLGIGGALAVNFEVKNDYWAPNIVFPDGFPVENKQTVIISRESHHGISIHPVTGLVYKGLARGAQATYSYYKDEHESTWDGPEAVR